MAPGAITPSAYQHPGSALDVGPVPFRSRLHASSWWLHNAQSGTARVGKPGRAKTFGHWSFACLISSLAGSNDSVVNTVRLPALVSPPLRSQNETAVQPWRWVTATKPVTLESGYSLSSNPQSMSFPNGVRWVGRMPGWPGLRRKWPGLPRHPKNRTSGSLGVFGIALFIGLF